MLASSARVATEHPTTYLRRLCEHVADESQRHSAQEFKVRFEDQEGLIDFAPVVCGSCRLDARQKDVLLLEVRGSDRAALERVQRIVTKHLERFARGERLTVEWGPGTERPATG